MVEPSGALSATVLGTPVSMFTPPTAMMVPWGAVLGIKKLPLPSVTTPTSFSDASATPLPLLSM